ncbi:hypothetical protein [Compostibacter hankyongensis]|uniref:SHOCT domain-containing protein n=1 Tax=Compostibacter hankyongensis TaxID=1007089 RepID=A0ABP8FVU5_9BACT
MKMCPLLILLLLPFFCRAQDNPQPTVLKQGMRINEAAEVLSHGYTTASGWTIRKGDTLHFGTGSLPTKRFAFIYQNPGNLFSLTSADMEHRAYLQSQYSNGYGIVKSIEPLGSKRAGWQAVAILKLGELSRFAAEIDNAVNAGEIVPPSQFSGRAQASEAAAPQAAVSTADELLKWKKLLDAGAVTQHEYDSVKTALLSGK